MSDDRSVATDALATLGFIIDEAQKRDAIHIAVEPIEAGEKLFAGQDVGISNGKAFAVTVGNGALGIVDPFLKTPVMPGQRFWLLVYPRQITSLRHVWSHPEFPENPVETPSKSARDKSEAWLRSFCDRSDCPDYETTVAAAVQFRQLEGYDSKYNAGEYVMIGGEDAHGEIPPEFWDHIEVVTGKKVPPEHRGTYFSCSC